MYEKVTKKELIKMYIESQKRSEDYDNLLRKYEIVVQARKEDADKVKESEKIISEGNARENAMHDHYSQTIIQLKSMLNDQNSTVSDLFFMMDNTLNLTNLYYEKYKSIFIKESYQTQKTE